MRVMIKKRKTSRLVRKRVRFLRSAGKVVKKVGIKSKTRVESDKTITVKPLDIGVVAEVLLDIIYLTYYMKKGKLCKR